MKIVMEFGDAVKFGYGFALGALLLAINFSVGAGIGFGVTMALGR